MKGRVALTVRLLTAMAIASSSARADDVVEYGAYLSGECVTCHRAESPNASIPSLAGRSREDILNALSAFKSGERPSPVMQDVAKRLADDEMLALAAYFASLSTSMDCRAGKPPEQKHC